MAATRKLQGEIDRCLKKVTEGVDTFEDIWKKVHNATNSNQKEKYEADLKKEIKKLQRLRDQIKSWIASAEIKDKSSLLENRRLIETQMERFKVVERETKTKAYSKEGLGAAQKLDPAQRVKDEVRQWLTTSISALQLQIDQYESEIESLLAGKKKRLDKDKQDRMDELRGKLDRHKFHITKLERLLRMLDNDTVEVEQVRRIKDDVEYYIESSQEPDFEENEYIYDDISGLDDQEIESSGTGIPSTTDSNDTGGSPSSLISGSSPVPSPTNLNCSFNHGSESASVDLYEKKSKNENAAIGTKITPVKPTAVRANKSDLNSTLSSNNTTISLAQNKTIVCSTPSKNQPSLNVSSVSTNAVQLTASGIAAILSSASTTVTTSISSISSITSAGIASSNQSSSSSTIIPTTAPVAFAAVAAAAKLGTSQQQQQQASTENGLATRQYSAFASTAISTATSHANQTGAHQSSSVINANQTVSNQQHTLQQHQIQSQPPVTIATSLASLSNIQNNNNNNNNNTTTTTKSSSNNVATSQHQLQTLHNLAMVTSGNNASNALDSHAIFTSITNNNLTTTPATSTINNSVTNSVSPTNSVVSSRTSPGLISPKPQHNVILNGPSQALAGIGKQQSQLVPNSLVSTDSMPSKLKTMAQDAIDRAAGLDNNSILSSSNLQPTSTSLASTLIDNRTQLYSANDSNGPHSGTNHNNNAINASSLLKSNIIGTGTNEAVIPPLLGVAPLGPCPLKKDHQLQFQMMEAAEYHLPTPADSERLRPYLPRQPCPTPAHYPQTQLPHSDTVEFFQRLSTETLFFIFYYMEGTKAQYLAAKALKKQSWRFHTKYMMWFQRHEEPKVINEEYEQGTYIYFDYEKWGQRKKEGFTFEYKYLEDNDLN